MFLPLITKNKKKKKKTTIPRNTNNYLILCGNRHGIVFIISLLEAKLFQFLFRRLLEPADENEFI